MLCCDHIEQMAGFARYAKQTVIDHCRTKIAEIHRERRKSRRFFVDSMLANKVWWWEHFWKWVSFGLVKKPTMRDVLLIYLGKTGETWPGDYQVKSLRWREMDFCHKVIRSARSCEGRSIFLSVETVSWIGL